MSDVVAALLLALATENAELCEQLASAQDMLVETAIDAGNMHALVEAMQTERDAWRQEAERLKACARRTAWGGVPIQFRALSEPATTGPVEPVCRSWTPT